MMEQKRKIGTVEHVLLGPVKLSVGVEIYA